jgi:hypothetical protein
VKLANGVDDEDITSEVVVPRAAKERVTAIDRVGRDLVVAVVAGEVNARRAPSI